MSDILPLSVRLLLLARTATSAAPLREMERLRAEAAALPGVASAVFAFNEEGMPSLRAALDALIEDGAAGGGAPVVIVPLIVVAEPSFETGLRKAIARWQLADIRRWPEIRIAPSLGDPSLVVAFVQAALATEKAGQRVVPDTKAAALEGSIVPAQKRRVLVCHGAPCIRAGAETVWGHLRNEQKRLGLRTAGEGAMSTTTSCLGPCSLAPVIQVWPEGTLYGGIDEAGIDRLVAGHLLKGEPVEDLAYEPSPGKQRLRSPQHNRGGTS